DEDPVVRIHGIANLVDGRNGSVHRSVEADGEVAAVDVFINRAGNSNYRDVEVFAELHCATERTVAANHHEPIDAALLQIIVSLLSSCFFVELFTPRGFKDGASALDDVCYRASFHFNDVVFDHALVSAHD